MLHFFGAFSGAPERNECAKMGRLVTPLENSMLRNVGWVTNSARLSTNNRQESIRHGEFVLVCWCRKLAGISINYQK